MSLGQNTLDRVRLFARQTQVRSVILGAGLGLVMAAFSKPAGYGFLCGVALSMINFWLMNADVFESAGMNPWKLRLMLVWRVIMRFSAIFGILALIAVKTSFNIVAAFAGLLFVQVVLITGQVVRGLLTLINTRKV